MQGWMYKMSDSEKENLNGEGAVEQPETSSAEVPSDSQLPEVPQETDEVSVTAGGDEEAENDAAEGVASDTGKHEPKKRAAVIVSAEEVEKSKVAEKRRVAAEAEKKKKRNGLLLKICIPIVVIAFVALAFFESNLFYRVMPAVKIGNTTYNVAEFDYFYTNSFAQMYQSLQSTYGDYVSYIVDTSKALKDQKYSDTQTWQDAVKANALDAMENMTCLYEAGQKAGFVLPEEYNSQIDTAVTSVESYATSYGYSVDDYLVAVYGKGMNEATYKKLVERTYYASAYSEEISNNPTPTTEEIQARYDQNPNDFDTVSFRYFYIAATSSDANAAETVAADAKKKADEMAAAKTEEEFMDLALANTATDSQADYDKDSATKATRISYSKVNSGYADWLFDTARKAGDTYVYEATSSDTGAVTGYYALYFVQRDDIHYNTVNVRHILITPEQDDTGNSTDEMKAAAKEKAEGLLQQWATNGGTEDAFIELAKANSADSGSASNGGLYENVYIGQMVQQFNDWCFDSARKTGDTGVIETSYGYHVMYFVGEGESYFDMTVTQKIEDERYNAWLEKNLPSYTATEQLGMKYGCNK